MLSLFSKNISLNALEKVNELLDISENRKIWKVMNVAFNVSTTIHEVLKKLDLDIFVPVKNEIELEDIAASHMTQKWVNSSLIAGVVFDFLHLDPTPHSKIGKIRIRMNPDSTILPKIQKAL